MNWPRGLLFSAAAIIGISAVITVKLVQLQNRAGSLPDVIPAPESRSTRALYPFSVIPGGVRNEEELRDSIARDPVVAEHYRDIRAARMLPMRLVRDLNAYVSYRSGQRIFWTHHLVRIKKGELVLTDGQSIIRGRCGNQIVPAYLRPKGVPSTVDPMLPPAEVFESGIPPLMEAPFNQAMLAEAAPHRAPVVPTTTSAPAMPYFPPIIPPVSWCCSGGSASAPVPGGPRQGGPGDTRQPPRDGPGGTPTPVPEPTTLVLLAMGFAALRLFSWKKI
jgi:PEP-CTERM motif